MKHQTEQNNHKFDDVEEPLIAYMAGLFDGEGSIGVYKPGKDPRNRWPSLRLQVGTTCQDVVRFLQARLGVGFIGQHVPSRASGHKTAWIWGCYGWNASALLHRFTPYLIVKKRQAELAIQFQEERRKQSAQWLDRVVAEMKNDVNRKWRP